MSDLTLTSDSEDGDGGSSVEPRVSANKKRASSNPGRDRNARASTGKRKRGSGSAEAHGGGVDYAAAAAAANAVMSKSQTSAASALAPSGAAISSAASALAAPSSTPVAQCIEVGLGPRFREGPEGYLLQAKNISELFELQAGTKCVAFICAWRATLLVLLRCCHLPANASSCCSHSHGSLDALQLRSDEHSPSTLRCAAHGKDRSGRSRRHWSRPAMTNPWHCIHHAR